MYTSQDGTFAYTFTPPVNESGEYTVWAVHPGLNDKPNQGAFSIHRLKASPTKYTLNIPKNYDYTISIKVVAGPATDATNLRLAYDALDQYEGSLVQGVNITLPDPVPVLLAGETATLDFTVRADSSAFESNDLVLKVRSDENTGGWATIELKTLFTEAVPSLYWTPAHVETGLAREEMITETVVLENKGLADLTGVTLQVVNIDGSPAPSWVMMNAAADQGFNTKLT